MTEQQFKEQHPDALTTEQLQDKYEVLGFSMGFCAVRDRQTGEKGSFNFTHIPRYYYGYSKAYGQ